MGVGTAGSVRIRDMLAPLPGSPAEQLALKGFISRYEGLAITGSDKSARSAWNVDSSHDARKGGTREIKGAESVEGWASCRVGQGSVKRS